MPSTPPPFPKKMRPSQKGQNLALPTKNIKTALTSILTRHFKGKLKALPKEQHGKFLEDIVKEYCKACKSHDFDEQLKLKNKHPDISEGTFLYYAAAHGQNKMVEHLLQNKKAPILEMAKGDAFVAAVEQSYRGTVIIFLENGVRPTKRVRKAVNSIGSVHRASEILSLFRRYDKNTPISKPFSDSLKPSLSEKFFRNRKHLSKEPLMYGVFKDPWSMVQRLEKYQYRQKDIQTMLKDAIKKRYIDTIHVLLEYGGDPQPFMESLALAQKTEKADYEIKFLLEKFGAISNLTLENEILKTDLVPKPAGPKNIKFPFYF